MTGAESLNVSREVEGNNEGRGKQNSLFPKGPVIKWFVIYQNKTEANSEIPATIMLLSITCNIGQHFAGNGELFPVWRHSFRNVARSWYFATSIISLVSYLHLFHAFREIKSSFNVVVLQISEMKKYFSEMKRCFITFC